MGNCGDFHQQVTRLAAAKSRRSAQIRNISIADPSSDMDMVVWTYVL
jgi:hypothetical protein